MKNEIVSDDRKFLKKSFKLLLVIPIIVIIGEIVEIMTLGLLFKVFPTGNGGNLTLKDVFPFLSLILPTLLACIGLFFIIMTLKNTEKNGKKTIVYGLISCIYHFILYCMAPLYNSILDNVATHSSMGLSEIAVYVFVVVIVICCFIAIMKYGKHEGIFESKKEQ